MKKRFSQCSVVLCLCLLLSACSSSSPKEGSQASTTPDITPQQTSAISTTPPKESSQASALKDVAATVLAKKDAQIAQLQNEVAELKEINEALAITSIDTDRLTMLFNSSGLLFKAARLIKTDLPIVVDGGNPIKKSILKAVDFQSPFLETKENEIILWAGVDLQSKDQTEAVVEMTVFQKAATQEEIRPIARRFMQMKKMDGKWEMVDPRQNRISPLNEDSQSSTVTDIPLTDAERDAMNAQIQLVANSTIPPVESAQGFSKADRSAIAEKDAQILELQVDVTSLKISNHALSRYSADPTRLDMLIESTNSLFEVVRLIGLDIPRLVDEGDPLKERILRSVDFQSPSLEVKDNEMITVASVRSINDNQTEALVEMSIFQKAAKKEEISPSAAKYIQMIKVDGKWKMIDSQQK